MVTTGKSFRFTKVYAPALEIPNTFYNCETDSINGSSS